MSLSFYLWVIESFERTGECNHSSVLSEILMRYIIDLLFHFLRMVSFSITLEPLSQYIMYIANNDKRMGVSLLHDIF